MKLVLASQSPRRKELLGRLGLEFTTKASHVDEEAFSAATPEELRTIADYSFRVNQYLGEYLAEVGIQLIDFKLEFGRTSDGTVILADEISPDTCRLWDKETNEKLDKDRFRRDLGNVEDAYNEQTNN